MRSFLALFALLALAACGGGDSNTTQPPVATTTAPAGKPWTDVYTSTGDGWVKQGNPDAPIKLIEYGSRSCPVCGAFAATGTEPLREKYIKTGQVSWEFRDFLVHAQDPGIALLGRCVATDAFFPVLDAMYANQTAFNQKLTTLDEATYQQMGRMPALDQAKAFNDFLGYTELMKQNGLSDQQMAQCLTQPKLDVLSAQLKEAADTKKVSGTPTFFINDVQAPQNTVSWEQLEVLLRRAGAH